MRTFYVTINVSAPSAIDVIEKSEYLLKQSGILRTNAIISQENIVLGSRKYCLN